MRFLPIALLLLAGCVPPRGVDNGSLDRASAEMHGEHVAGVDSFSEPKVYLKVMANGDRCYYTGPGGISCVKP